MQHEDENEDDSPTESAKDSETTNEKASTPAHQIENNDPENGTGENPGLRSKILSKLKTLGIATALGAGGYMASILWTIPFRESIRLPWLEPSYSGQLIMSYAALALGAVTIGILYLHYSDKGLDYIDIHVPHKRQLALIIGGTLALLFTFYLIASITDLFEASGSKHTIQQTVATGEIDPRFILLMIPLSILVIGPSEEFIFRNLVQKRLYEDFSIVSSIILSSSVFTIFHYPAYTTGTLTQIIISLITVFGLSIILGAVYAWTENLLVPAFIHGAYNATVFANWYTALAFGFTFL